jgi:hypothetical protein
LKTGPNFFSSAFQKQNNLQFCEICGYKKGYDNTFFSPLPSLLLRFLDQGSEIRDPGWVKNQDPGSGIIILDPQHWFYLGTGADFITSMFAMKQNRFVP